MIDVVDTPLDVDDDTFGYSYGSKHDSIFGWGNSAKDIAIRERRSTKRATKEAAKANSQSLTLANLSKAQNHSGQPSSSENTGTGIPSDAGSIDAPIQKIQPAIKEDNTILYVGIGAGVLFAIGVIILIIKMGR